MNDKINDFLDEVCSRIKYKKIHEEIREELTAHILENSESSDISVEEAILQMGNGAEIGEKLNKEHKPQTEWSVLALGAIIALFGGVIMYTSSKVENWYVDFGKYLFFVVFGLIALVCFYFFDYTKLKKLSLPIYFTALLYFLVRSMLGTFYTGSGAMWLRIGTITISSWYAIFLFIIAFAGFIDKYRGQGGFAIVKLIILGVISVFPLAAGHNSGLLTVMMICYAVLTVTAVMRNHFGGSKKMQLISLGGLSFSGIGIITLYVVKEGYLSRRIEAFLSRGQSDPLNYGWQQRMADNLLSSSKWYGEADAGKDWELYLPAAANDQILVNVITTFGWAVGIALIIFVSLFIIRMFMTVKKVKADYGFYLSLAACAVLSVQFIVSILMNFGLLPLTSMSMPFVSYGGAGYVISMALVGIILSVWRRNNLVRGNIKPLLKTPRIPLKTQLHKLVQRIEFRDGKLTINFNKHIT